MFSALMNWMSEKIAGKCQLSCKTRDVNAKNIPGMNMVWNPPMKMICILPNCFIPSLRRSRSDHPSLAQKIALKKQMLKVKLMSFALASQVVLLQNASAL